MCCYVEGWYWIMGVSDQPVQQSKKAERELRGRGPVWTVGSGFDHLYFKTKQKENKTPNPQALFLVGVSQCWSSYVLCLRPFLPSPG